MPSTQEQENKMIVLSNSLEEDHLPEPSSSSKTVKNTNSASSLSNSKFTTTISSPSSVNVTKRYISKFKKEWLSNPKYSSFLKECKYDQTKALCCICNVQFSIQNSGVTDVNAHMKTKKHQDCVKSIEANKCNDFAIIFHNKLLLFFFFSRYSKNNGCIICYNYK